jgi:hypothetical protein
MNMNEVLKHGSTAHDGIALEKARLCTVCWTIHLSEECPGCGARQWHKLMDVLMSVASGAEFGKEFQAVGNDACLHAMHGGS